MMDLTEQFASLGKLIHERSDDTQRMGGILDVIRNSYEIARFTGHAQDKLYASIARGHRKVLEHLQRGRSVEAMSESAAAVAWFYLRFRADDPGTLTNYPHIAEELRSVRELASSCEILKDAIRQAESHGTS